MAILLNAQTTIATLLNLMAIPATLMASAGGYLWYKGHIGGVENKSRMGRMLLMFGVIMITIILILSYFIAEYNLMKAAAANGAASL